MGWLSVIVGVLVLATFLYNLFFNKEKPVALIKEALPVLKRSEETSRHEGKDRDESRKPNNKPATQSQLPSIASIVEPDEQDSIPTILNSTIPQPPKLMLPPPLPPTNKTTSSSSMAPAPAPSPPRPQSPPRLKPPTMGRPPSAPRPLGGGTLRPPPSAASSLRVPVTKVLSNTSMAPSSSSLMPPPKKVSKQVTLEPGHSPLDWAALTADPSNELKGKDAPPNSMIRVTPSQLKAQNGRKGKDAWTVYQGKVYNITPYVPFHPGGKGELLRGAGKDSAKLFMEVHPWVNWDGMLAECCVGILVGEEEARESLENTLDEMD